MNVKTELKHLYTDIKALRDKTLREYEQYPPGTIQCYSHQGRKQYVQVIRSNGARERRGINREHDTLRSLARKKYVGYMLQLLDKNLMVLESACRNTVAFDPNEILRSVKESLSDIPDEYFLKPLAVASDTKGNSELARRMAYYQKWADENYARSNYKPSQCRVTTTMGLNVRSKSEALIANLLHEHGIPFRYEQIVRLGEKVIVPDFSFLSSSGREIYWEHAGMLDDPRYAFSHHLKMMQYESGGIYPWQNLIVTYDTGNEINMPMIESIVKNLLVPAL